MRITKDVTNRFPVEIGAWHRNSSCCQSATFGIEHSANSMQWTTTGGECIDFAAGNGIGLESRCQMSLGARVNHHRAAATPVLLFVERMHAEDVCRGIAAGECYPQEIAQRRSAERGVIDEHDHWESSYDARGNVLQSITQ